MLPSLPPVTRTTSSPTVLIAKEYTSYECDMVCICRTYGVCVCLTDIGCFGVVLERVDIQNGDLAMFHIISEYFQIQIYLVSNLFPLCVCSACTMGRKHCNLAKQNASNIAKNAVSHAEVISDNSARHMHSAMKVWIKYAKDLGWEWPQKQRMISDDKILQFVYISLVDKV